MNATVTPEYGGAGLGEIDNALIAEELAWGCTGIQTSMLANTLALTPIRLGGSDEQKKKYLGMLTAEPLFASYCTTEPSGGSDVAGMKTTFKKVGDDYVLNGEKCWITNASFASFYVVFATSDPAKRHKGIAAFIVDRDSPGLRVGKHEDKLGQRASDTAAVHFEDVKVPKANFLAPEGEGFKLAMETFNQTRPDIGAMAAGLMQRCLDESVSYARFYVVFATSSPELRHKGIAAFIVDRDTPGLRPGKKEDKLGQRASDTAQVFFEDVKVPKANLLAPEGQGFKLAMETFNQTRPDIAAAATGIMRRCLDECVAYAKERKTFGVAIAQHQLVAAMIAEMAIRCEATRLLYWKAAKNLDLGVRDPMTSSFAKAFGADSAMTTAVDAVQVFGGNGYVKEYPVEKLMRDAKVLQIYEGTSQIQRIVIARNLFGG